MRAGKMHSSLMPVGDWARAETLAKRTSFQLCVLRLDFLQDGDVGVGVFLLRYAFLTRQ